MKTAEIIEIANQYLIDNNITEPYLQCERVSLGLSLRFKELGVNCHTFAVSIDINRYTGVIEPYMANWQSIEHHVIKIGSKVLDATASQFKDMPLIYYGSRPMFYP